MALFTKRFGRCPLSRRNVDAARDLMNEGPIVTLSKLGPTQRDTTFFQAGLYLGHVVANEALPEIPERLLCPLSRREEDTLHGKPITEKPLDQRRWWRRWWLTARSHEGLQR